MNQAEQSELQKLDKVFIKNLMVRGIVGINPEERKNRQDILVNVTMWTDTRTAAAGDTIDDAVNYRTAAKAIIAHIEAGAPLLVERLVSEVAEICLKTNQSIAAVEVTVEKPGAVRFAESVGVTIRRTRAEMVE